MKRSFLWVAFVFMCSTASYAQAVETGTMRCSGGLVSIGDTAGEVLAKCGEPAYKTQGVRTRAEHQTTYSDRGIISVPVDEWIFNFGPNEFQYQVQLESGRVTRIESLDYGY